MTCADHKPSPPSVIYGRYRHGERLTVEQHAIELVDDVKGTATRSLTLTLQYPFLPYTFLIWGAKADMRLLGIILEGRQQLLTRVPGSLFECELDWREFQSLGVELPGGAVALDNTSIDTIGHFFRVDMPSVAAGGTIVVEVEGEFDHLVVLGRAVVT